MLNFNMGRSYFFAKMTREIKFLDNKPDLRGMYPAQITNLLTGAVSLRPVKLLPCRFDRGISIEIH
jgi:hypothetical protein